MFFKFTYKDVLGHPSNEDVAATPGKTPQKGIPRGNSSLPPEPSRPLYLRIHPANKEISSLKRPISNVAPLRAKPTLSDLKKKREKLRIVPLEEASKQFDDRQQHLHVALIDASSWQDDRRRHGRSPLDILQKRWEEGMRARSQDAYRPNAHSSN